MTKKLSLFLALGLAVAASSAFANPVPIGSNGVTPDTFGSISGTVLATQTYSATVGDLSASYTEWVLSDPALSLCAGCLDFVIEVTNNDAVGGDDIEHVNLGPFSTYTTDAGYATSLNGTPGGSVNPTGVSRVVANTVSFAELLGPTQTSSYLVVETNSPTYQAGLLDVSIQDTSSINGPGFAPGPEPMSVALLGGGLALLGGFARLRRSKKS